MVNIETDKDLIYHMQEVANKLVQDDAVGYLRLGLKDL